MADIKSSLEIALERAAALEASSSQDEEREARERGEAWTRAFLNGDIAPEEYSQRWASLSPAGRPAALGVALESLAQALGQGSPQALAGLRVLTQGKPAAEPLLKSLEEVLASLEQEVLRLEAVLSQRALEELAELGIRGDAVRPNALAHPDFPALWREGSREAYNRLSALTDKLGELLLG
ncbi:MAG: hypothetical protein KQJ78_19020 [Deltaproteobacteria bacterium]|nr:hypothetical protein [Deltaproteobacteria bacterium]